MNQAMIFGRVGRDPKVHTTGGGKKVAGFSVATSEKFTNGSGERQEKTTWHNVKVWGPLAEIVEARVRKGIEVLVVGKIENGFYEKDGQKVNTSEVVVQGPGSILRIFDGGKKPDAGGEPLPGEERTSKRIDHDKKDDKLEDTIPF